MNIKNFYDFNKNMYIYLLLKYPNKSIKYVYKMVYNKNDYIDSYYPVYINCNFCRKDYWVTLYEYFGCESGDTLYSGTCPHCSESNCYDFDTYVEKPTMVFLGLQIKDFNEPHIKQKNTVIAKKRGRFKRAWARNIVKVNRELKSKLIN